MTTGAERVNVCLVSALPPPYGGLGKWTELVLRQAAGRRDVTIDVVDISPHWREFHDMVVWKRMVGGGLQLVRDVARLSALLLTRRPSAVHLATPGRLAVVRDVVMLSVARALRTPSVYHIHFGRVPEIAAEGTREWRAMRRAIGLADAVVPMDRATEETLRRHFPAARIERIPNCIDLTGLEPAPLGEDHAPRTAVYLGWLIPTKGIEELLAAWALVRPEGWRLRLVGPCGAPYRAYLEARRPPGVELAGELPHDAAMRAVAAADVFVFPSHTEGFPNAVLEAMALGKPIVASQVGAIPEMLEDGCGVLVPPRDVDALAKGLARVLGDAGLRRELGARARARARAEYAVEAVFERYLEFWRGRAGGHG